jgi:hypothetical protein
MTVIDDRHNTAGSQAQDTELRPSRTVDALEALLRACAEVAANMPTEHVERECYDGYAQAKREIADAIRHRVVALMEATP